MSNTRAEGAMLIRASIHETFDAFVNPTTIKKFWLEDTTGPLSTGAQVKWTFMVPGATETVEVTRFDQDKLIVFDWSEGISVKLEFKAVGEGATHVAFEASGFDPLDTSQVVNATEGFSIVLCDLKTLLESGQSANLVKDKAVLIATL